MKGIVLAGGAGTRLSPLTQVVSKQLLPVYDKPVIFYSLSTLLHAGVNEVLVITNPENLKDFQNLLGTGSEFGISIEYEVQNSPRGVAEALLIGRNFLSGENFWLILGDNLFHGPNFGRKLKEVSDSGIATVFSYHVNNPEEFGVMIYDVNGRPESIQEKPSLPVSNWAIPGLYFLNQMSINYAEKLSPSSRGELEITDVLSAHLKDQSLNTMQVSRGNAWFDLGSFDSLLKASNFVQMIQSIQGQRIGDPHEAAINARKLK